jgi:hypothetical protein
MDIVPQPLTTHECTLAVDIARAMQQWANTYRPTVSKAPTVTPCEIGQSLKVIRDKQLYRATAHHFYVYCALKWGMLPEKVEQYIELSDGATMPPAPPKPPLQTYIYFLLGGDKVKIGVTRDIRARIDAIRTMSPVPITLLCVIPGTPTKEKELHQRFAQHRAHGEWFVDCAEIRAFIAEMVQA